MIKYSKNAPSNKIKKIKNRTDIGGSNINSSNKSITIKQNSSNVDDCKTEKPVDIFNKFEIKPINVKGNITGKIEKSRSLQSDIGCVTRIAGELNVTSTQILKNNTLIMKLIPPPELRNFKCSEEFPKLIIKTFNAFNTADLSCGKFNDLIAGNIHVDVDKKTGTYTLSYLRHDAVTPEMPKNKEFILTFNVYYECHFG